MCDNNTRIITSRRRKKKMIAGPEIWEIRQMYLLVRIIVCIYIYIIFYIYHYSFGIIVCPRIRSFLMRRRWWSSAPGHFLLKKRRLLFRNRTLTRVLQNGREYRTGNADYATSVYKCIYIIIYTYRTYVIRQRL